MNSNFKYDKHFQTFFWLFSGEIIERRFFRNQNNLVQSHWTRPVWPDLAKFHHFGNSLRVYFVLGKILNLIWQNFMILDNFYCCKWPKIIYSIIWSHWMRSPPLMHCTVLHALNWWKRKVITQMMHDKVAGVIGRDDSRHSSMDLSVPTVLRPRVRSTAQPLRFSSLHFNCDERRTKIKTKRGRDLKKKPTKQPIKSIYFCMLLCCKRQILWP